MERVFDWLQIFLGLLGVGFLALIAVALVFLIFKRGQPKAQETKVKVINLNEKYEDMRHAVRKHMLNKKELKALAKQKKAEAQGKDEAETEKRKKVFVLDFEGDVSASKVSVLREQITSLVDLASTNDEVVVRLESAGGVVHGYGLAASQLGRLKQRDIKLTVCVDKVAASGGYMMACVANQILSAPFAILGSIGVFAGIPNLNRLLRKNDVEYLELTAGEYKRTVTMLGEVTEKGREKFMEQLENTHILFKNFVASHRPVLDIAKVATGEHWFGTQALDLKLVDALRTSDDYLLEQSKSADVLLLEYAVRETLKDKIVHFFSATLQKALEKNFFAMLQ